MKLALAQLDLLVGDVAGNVSRIVDTAAHARDVLRADLVVFPELTLTGYPPEDLLLHAGLRDRVAAGLARLSDEVKGIGLIVGLPEWEADDCFNCAVLLSDGRILGKYRKALLPNYAVFDEKRYFKPGHDSCVVEFAGARIGLTICEDLWFQGPAQDAVNAGAELLVNISASPFQIGRQSHRERDVFGRRARETGVPVVCVNLVGGQDELVFDGGSVVLDARAEVRVRAPSFAEAVVLAEFERHTTGHVEVVSGGLAAEQSVEESVWHALTLGIRDYVEKNNFPGVVLGLSGGIDSALVATLAVDALGADRVQTVMMPSRHTSAMSVEDAALLAHNLGVTHRDISIEPAYGALLDSLAPSFGSKPVDTAEQNLQARVRGTILMGLSNKFGWLLLLTGNKSEFAVGYSTLYGDMAGGFAPLKDCSKTLVYALARWRNGDKVVIPRRSIERPPSAELAPGQLDQDTLPPYAELDAIIRDAIELELSEEDLVRRGHDAAAVTRVVSMIRVNEYKRRQAAPGVRITSRAFGRDRRYPITSGYR